MRLCERCTWRCSLGRADSAACRYCAPAGRTRRWLAASDQPRRCRAFGPACPASFPSGPQADNDGELEAFYEQLMPCDVADVLRFVNRRCRFLAAPLAASLCQAGRRRELPARRDRRTGDEPRQPLDGTHQRHSLPRAGNHLPAVPAAADPAAANDRISNAIAELVSTPPDLSPLWPK
jgi:hypothetical protein